MTSLATPRIDPQRKPAIASAALIAVCIALVAFGRHDRTPVVLDSAAVINSVELKFVDRPDGSVVAIDADSGAQLGQIAVGVGGFVRVTMRSFANERRQRGMNGDVPFRLTRMNDGDLYLQDPQTGRSMLLNAFGPANEGVFAQLLDDRRTTQ